MLSNTTCGFSSHENFIRLVVPGIPAQEPLNLTHEVQVYTALSTSQMGGQHELTRLGMGLKDSSACLMRALELLMKGLTYKVVFCYIDDFFYSEPDFRRTHDTSL